MKTVNATSAVLAVLMVSCTPAVEPHASSDPETLYREFMNPDASARPRVWWHWMNGNVTADGIRKDLEWMDRAGIAGFHNFDAGMEIPQIVDRRLAYMTPEWKDAFNYALDIADSLGMEVAVASSPGWSITGGPWVGADDAEKKLVWSSMDVDGGVRIECPLPEPETVCGPYRDIPEYPSDPHRYDYYRDLFVLAWPLPEAEVRAQAPQISEGPGWVRLDYPGLQDARFLDYVERTGAAVCLEADDGDGNYETVIPELPLSIMRNVGICQIDFRPVRARSFRIRALNPEKKLDILGVSLCPVVRIDRSYAKSGFWTDYHISDACPTPDTADAVPSSEVLDITRFCRDGRLGWKVPEGRWRIMRFGYNLLGRVNGPASPEATGLEVDKLDAGAVRRYYENYLPMYQDASGGRLGSAIKCLMIDSYESGKCSWTADMEREFRKRRGYDLRPWAPVLAGVVVGSAERSEQFLFDWRRTLGELLAENHYDLVDGILDSYGMTRYTESHEERTAFVGDGMMVKRHADVPMSAIWARYRAGWHSSYPPAEADVRESSSVAHIYGQNICAAESFTTNGTIGKWDGTGAYQCSPSNLKPLADAAMALGLNRFVIHTSVHQPCDDVIPGLGLGPYGQWFNRHDTWAEEARSWTDYLSRSCFLLQQGRWVADIAYFYGEDKNITGRFYDERIDIPRGYNYDFINADILLNVLRRDGRALTTASGMRYRMLVLDPRIKYMSLPVLKRIFRLVRAGVPLYGSRPLFKANMKGSERRFSRICARIWDAGRSNVHSCGSLEEALAAEGIAPDVDLAEAGDADVRFVHRRLDAGEFWWVANITAEPRTLRLSFNVSGRRPRIWHADSGLREDPSYRMCGGRTEVEFRMSPDDAQFVMFLDDTSENSRFAPSVEEKLLSEIGGPWDVKFQKGRGAPERASFPELKSFSECSDEGVRFFSGTASYAKTFSIGAPLPQGRILLDLGEVHHMARVFLNGKDLGLAWKAPYRLEAGGILREGANELRIDVTDSWANRIIGDERKAPEQRITYTPRQFYTSSDEPVPAGLVGPVRIISVN